MSIDLFSKRQKKLRGEVPDVYQYEKMPDPLRVQVIHIMNDAMGDRQSAQWQLAFKSIHNILCREYGLFRLGRNIEVDDQVIDFILKTENVEQVIDAIELTFRFIDFNYRNEQFTHNYYHGYVSIAEPTMTPDEAIDELNARFQEHGVGYQYESREIVRVDSQFIHSETVKPVLHLLSSPRFQGSNKEFLNAHEHYRHGRYKDCIVACLAFFESTMKIICHTQKWQYGSKDTAKQLINTCLKNNLISSYLQTQFSTLQQNLESGIPTVRNNNGGHGQSTQQASVPQYFASYQLHMIASTILFLIEAEKNLL